MLILSSYTSYLRREDHLLHITSSILRWNGWGLLESYERSLLVDILVLGDTLYLPRDIYEGRTSVISIQCRNLVVLILYSQSNIMLQCLQNFWLCRCSA